LVLSALAAAVYIWAIVRIVNWWQSPDGHSERRRKRGAMFWITIALLAVFPLLLAAALLFGWLSKALQH
jgi:NADH:ubiquinone oxidoreductase subunit 2 (subunit N)